MDRQIDQATHTQRSMASPVSTPKSSQPEPWIYSTQADIVFACAIVLNALVLGGETDGRTPENEGHIGWFISDSFFNSVFLVELLMRMCAGIRAWVRDAWNWFDLLLVIIGVSDTWVIPLIGGDSEMRFLTLMRLFRLLKLLRILRVVRLIRYLKELILLVEGISSAMRAMVYGLLLLGLTIFMCSMLMTRLVGKQCCEQGDTFTSPIYREYFGSLFQTAFTLFQFTMEFQPHICRQTWNDGVVITLVLIAYTGFTNITLLNVVASVIVENILSIAQKTSAEDELIAKELEMQQEIHSLSTIFMEADRNGTGELEWEELCLPQKGEGPDPEDGSSGTGQSLPKGNILSAGLLPSIERALTEAGILPKEAEELFSVLDADDSGAVTRDEFVKGLLRMKHPPRGKDMLALERKIAVVQAKVDETAAAAKKAQDETVAAITRIERQQEELLARLGGVTRQQNHTDMPRQTGGILLV